MKCSTGFAVYVDVTNQEKHMKENKCPKGVNPKAYEQWKKEDREERAKAVEELYRALFRLEELYEVPSESEHPLEKAYELIWDWADEQGINPE